MKKRDRDNVASAIASKSQQVTLEQLAAKGKRTIHVVSADDALRVIESFVDKTLEQRVADPQGGDRFWQEAGAKILQAALTGEARGEIASRVEALEGRIQRELEEIRSSLESLSQRPLLADQAFLNALTDELSRREESTHLAREERLRAALNGSVETIRKTVLAGQRGADSSAEATDLIVSTMLDDQDDSLESNVTSLEVSDSPASESVSKNLARLKQLRGSDSEVVQQGTGGEQDSKVSSHCEASADRGNDQTNNTE